MDSLTVGNRVIVEHNSIFRFMGFGTVTGIVQAVYKEADMFAFKCDQTGSVENIAFEDGNIEVVE